METHWDKKITPSKLTGIPKNPDQLMLFKINDHNADNYSQALEIFDGFLKLIGF